MKSDAEPYPKFFHKWGMDGVQYLLLSVLQKIYNPQTHINTGFAKKFKKISTHLLTVLTISVIVQLEQRKKQKKKIS